MEFRRRVPRQMAGLVVHFGVVGDSVDKPRACRVLDISEFGVGILFPQPRGSELIGRHVSLETPKHGASVNIPLEGEVRYAVPAVVPSGSGSSLSDSLSSNSQL
jgi:hypothetical protein